MSKAHPPELKKFMDKKLSLKLNGGRHVQGILRGFDPFMNLVVDDCLEMAPGGQQNNIGMVPIHGAIDVFFMAPCGAIVDLTQSQGYSYCSLGTSLEVIRGNSIIMLEALERV